MKKDTERSIHVSLSPWVIKEIIGDSDNRSSRVEELLIKGYMAQKVESAKQAGKNNVVSRLTSHDLQACRMEARPFITLMLSGHCTTDRGIGQRYYGMEAVQ